MMTKDQGMFFLLIVILVFVMMSTLKATLSLEKIAADIVVIKNTVTNK